MKYWNLNKKCGTKCVDIDVLQPQHALFPQPNSEEPLRIADDRRKLDPGLGLYHRGGRVVGQRE